jgi:hypothetical protein
MGDICFQYYRERLNEERRQVGRLKKHIGALSAELALARKEQQSQLSTIKQLQSRLRQQHQEDHSEQDQATAACMPETYLREGVITNKDDFMVGNDVKKSFSQPNSSSATAANSTVILACASQAVGKSEVSISVGTQTDDGIPPKTRSAVDRHVGSNGPTGLEVQVTVAPDVTLSRKSTSGKATTLPSARAAALSASQLHSHSSYNEPVQLARDAARKRFDNQRSSRDITNYFMYMKF